MIGSVGQGNLGGILCPPPIAECRDKTGVSLVGRWNRFVYKTAGPLQLRLWVTLGTCLVVLRPSASDLGTCLVVLRPSASDIPRGLPVLTKPSPGPGNLQGLSSGPTRLPVVTVFVGIPY